MPEMSGGEAVIQALRAEGVETVFGIPGLHNLALYDAMLRLGAPRHILARHEQGAAFMADGYARASGRVGVCLATTGPGALNTLTAVAESYASSIPTLVIMSDIPSPLLGLKKGALHEIPDQIRLFEPVTAWSETSREVSAIPRAIHRAFRWLRTSRPRPIALSIPTDLLAERAECLIQQGEPGVRPPADPNLIAQAADLLRRAQRPAVLVGGGVIASEASVEVQAVCERLQAPVITTIMGRGAIPDTSPLVIAVLQNKGNSLPVLHSADVILAVGTRFAHRATQSRPVPLRFSPEQTLIHVDLDPAEVGKMYQPTLGIVGDAQQV
ncbi:MAG: thiamine pyrophosphate-binding protein, partial [Candidatus Methylomirabilales bacterium]